MNRPARLVEPTRDDLAGLLALSTAAHWNQRTDDWTWMLAHGRTRAIRENDTLVASALVLPWPASRPEAAPRPQAASRLAAASLAWISMVLVLPEHRGKGHARRLLEESLAWLKEPAQQHLLPVLDATPAGRPVYLKLGFADQWGFTRWEHRSHQREHSPSLTDGVVELAAMSPAQRHTLGFYDLDLAAFGADRGSLLDDLIRRAPDLALALCKHMTAQGFVLARPGRVATQIGPLVASDTASALVLTDQALARVDGAVFVDVPDSRRDFADGLAARGFVPQRPFTRMALASPGGEALPADPGTLFAVAGPELG